MHTGLISHADCLGHATPPGHPECPDRLRVILTALEGEAFAYLIREEAPVVDRAAVERVHPAAHVDKLWALMPQDPGTLSQIDPDTVASPGTWRAAERAAGSVIAAVDGIAAGAYENAFCAVRPPGHHAEPDRSMGFCLFNNAAIGALHARVAHGWQRVAVVDIDVHHGNGSQELAMTDPDFFYASVHEDGIYPYTGQAHEVAPGGNLVNAPVPSGAGGPEWRAIVERRVLPSLEAFNPDLVIISAGFDAHTLDPLANLNLTEADFAWATREIGKIARRACDGRLVSTLEGGYSLPAIARSSAAHVMALMET